MPKIFTFLFLFFVTYLGFSQENEIIKQLDLLTQQAKGKLCVYAYHFEDSASINYYGDEMCVQQSVFKFPIALAVLEKIDKGDFSLQHKIHITAKDMQQETWSPLRDSFPNGNINVTFENLLKYMVSQSDNIACDVLIHHLGKAKSIEKFVRKFDIDDIKIRYNEEKMQKNWKNQYKNIGTPKAYVQLLQQFYDGKIISKPSTDFLYKVMVETTTGKNRIVNLLPENCIVAHKTGSSGTNKDGMTAATNDVGIITLPNGKHIGIVIFVQDAFAAYNIIEKTIAETALLIVNHYNK